MVLTEEAIAGFTARQRAVLKLRFGGLPLTDVELQTVLPAKRAGPLVTKPRSLQEVGELFGITRERVRQIEQRLQQRLRGSSSKPSG